MRVRVTDEGLLIPTALLRDLDEVEIRWHGDGVLITPVAANESSENEDNDENYPVIPDDDPIYNLGRDPIDIGITDASVNFDKYIYGDATDFPTLADDDPLYELGRYPVEDEATDAAVKLDKYLY